MRKYFAVLLILILILPCFGAEKENVVKVGILSHSGTTQEEFQEGFERFRESLIISNNNENKDSEIFISAIIKNRHLIYFYDSLMPMIMGMKAGKVNEIFIPEDVGRYISSNDGSCKVTLSTDLFLSKISFGFREDSAELQNEFNKAIKSMKDDGTLDSLAEKYIFNFKQNSRSITPDKFDGSEVIKIAVTGDMPPIDMFAGDGKPAGYNTAVLAEIGRRLGKNIRFVNVNSSARSAALYSGKADAVLWYITKESKTGLEKIFDDVPEGVILSIPYYSWDEEFIVRTAKNNTLQNLFKKGN